MGTANVFSGEAMNRRDFMIATGTGLGAVWPGSKTWTASVSTMAGKTGVFLDDGGETRSEPSYQSEPTYHVLGVPLRAGSLYPGNENDAQAYREVQLLARLNAVGCNALDEGDVAIPSYLPHHSIPPIRSWPGPRIAWDCVRQRIEAYLLQPMHIPLLIGCDCSVVVGTTQALRGVAAENVHVLYIDGDFDDAAPDPKRCQSAASCAVWLLTHDSPFWSGPPLRSSQVTVIGWSNPSQSSEAGIRSMSLADIRRTGFGQAARQALEALPASASILLHVDIDVFRKQDLPAAYFPHTEGMSLAEGRELLGVLLRDPRIRIIEVSEYATLRDLDRSYVSKLVDLLSEGLKK
jgi:arginase